MRLHKRALWLLLAGVAGARYQEFDASPGTDSACTEVKTADEINQVVAEADEEYLTLCAAPDAGRCV